MKKILLTAVLALACVTACGLAWLRYGSGDWIARRISEYSRQYTGSEIAMQQEPVAHIFPPALALGGLSWESPDKNMVVSARSLNLTPDALSLLMGRLNLKEILLDGAYLKINLHSGAAKGEEPAKVAAQNSKTESAKVLPLEIGRLIAQKGKVDLYLQGVHIGLNEVNLTADDLRNRQEARLSGDFVLSAAPVGGDQDSAWLAGNLAFRGRARFYDPNLTLRQTAITFTATKGEALAWLSPMQLALDLAINLDDLEARANQASLSSAPGKLTFRGNANFRSGDASGQCTLALDLPRILGQAPDAAFADDESMMLIDSPIEVANSVISLTEIAVKSGLSEGSGNLLFRLPKAGAPCALSGKLAFRKLALWAARESDRSDAQAATKAVAKTGSPPFSLFPELDMRLAAEDFQYGSLRAKKMRATIQGAEGNYALKDGAMNWADGIIEASATGNFAGSLFEVKANGKNINAGLGLQESGFKGFTGGHADFQASLSTRGLDMASLRSTLSGNASFTASDIKINLLEKISRFLPADTAAKYFPDAVRQFMTEMRANNGQLDIDTVKLEAKSLAATGTAHYSPASGKIDGKLDLKVGPVSLPLAFSGPANDISWSVTGGFFRQLLRDFP